jgi:hypothetical protein
MEKYERQGVRKALLIVLGERLASLEQVANEKGPSEELYQAHIDYLSWQRKANEILTKSQFKKIKNLYLRIRNIWAK